MKAFFSIVVLVFSDDSSLCLVGTSLTRTGKKGLNSSYNSMVTNSSSLRRQSQNIDGILESATKSGTMKGCNSLGCFWLHTQFLFLSSPGLQMAGLFYINCQSRKCPTDMSRSPFMGWGCLSPSISSLFKVRSHCGAHSDLELTILLLQPLECWNYGCIQPWTLWLLFLGLKAQTNMSEQRKNSLWRWDRRLG